MAAGITSCPRVLRRPSIYLENDSSVSTSYLLRAQTQLHMKSKSMSQSIQTLYLGTSTKSVHNTNSDTFDNHTSRVLVVIREGQVVASRPLENMLSSINLGFLVRPALPPPTRCCSSYDFFGARDYHEPCVEIRFASSRVFLPSSQVSLLQLSNTNFI